MNAPIIFVIWAADSVSRGRRTGPESNTLSDWLEGISVILPGFVGKTEEHKEGEGAENNAPSWELHCCLNKGLSSPYYRRNLRDFREIVMNIVPTDVWVKGNLRIKSYAVQCYWYIEQNFKTGKAHESNEAIGGEVAIAWEYGFELGIVFMEGNDSHDGVGGREESDDYRRQGDDGKYWPSIIDGRGTAIIFENVESMTLNNVVCDSWSEKM